MGGSHTVTVMCGERGTRNGALVVLCALAAASSVGIATLAHAGVALCSRRLFAGDASMAGMAMPAGGFCPILLFAAFAAVAACACALIVLVGSRSNAGAIAKNAARLVLAARTPRVAGLLALAGAVPLVGTLLSDDSLRLDGGTAWSSLLALVVGATLTAIALTACARAVVALTRRVVVAFLAALHLAAAAARTRVALRGKTVLRISGLLIARRHRSRAPPIAA